MINRIIPIKYAFSKEGLEKDIEPNTATKSEDTSNPRNPTTLAQDKYSLLQGGLDDEIHTASDKGDEDDKGDDDDDGEEDMVVSYLQSYNSQLWQINEIALVS